MSHQHDEHQHAAAAPDAPKPRKHPILIIVMVRRPAAITVVQCYPPCMLISQRECHSFNDHVLDGLATMLAGG